MCKCGSPCFVASTITRYWTAELPKRLRSLLTMSFQQCDSIDNRLRGLVPVAGLIVSVRNFTGLPMAAFAMSCARLIGAHVSHFHERQYKGRTPLLPGSWYVSDHSRQSVMALDSSWGVGGMVALLSFSPVRGGRCRVGTGVRRVSRLRFLFLYKGTTSAMKRKQLAAPVNIAPLESISK